MAKRTTQELVEAWCRATYPKHAEAKAFQVALGIEYSGFCETCRSENPVIKVYADRREIDSFDTYSVVEFLDKILTFDRAQ